jgi:hypothetical protein
MKALAFLILAFPLYSWANLVGVQTIHPAADQTLDFDFGKVPVGETYYTSFTLTAPADKDLKITEITINGDMYDAFTDCGEVLAAGTACETEVDFSPTTVGNHEGQLGFATDQGNILVNLKGEGVESTLSKQK